jgi:YVTN family beta-propeller protein
VVRTGTGPRVNPEVDPSATLGSVRRSSTPERVLATVLFTDIVGSTELAVRLGDRRWRDLVAAHHRAVRAQLKRYRGREIDTAGDGFFATFDRPAQAISCAIAIIESLRPLGIEIRAGIHAGEVELSGGKAGGIAVHTAARVLATAQPGEIVATATIKELVAGSNIEFVDRGTTTLKGIPGEWRLFVVVQPESVAPQDASAPPTAMRGEGAERRAHVSRGLLIGGIAAVAVIGAAAVVLSSTVLKSPIIPAAGTVGHIPAGGDAFDRAVTVGSQPSGLTFGADAVWVLNFRDATLSRIDPATGEVTATRAVGGTPTGLAFGADAVWVTTGFGQASGDVGSVVQFDAQQATIETTIPVGNGVSGIAFGEGAVWAVDRNRELVVRIDPNSPGAVPDEIPVGRGPQAVAVGAGGVWVTSILDNTLLRIDPTTLEAVATIPLLEPPTAIAVGDGAVWVTSESGDTVTRIDVGTNRPDSTIGVGNGPLGVVATGGAVWIALGGDGQLAQLDPATETVVATYPVDGAPDGLTADDQGGVWVSVHAP